jgi:hypothetical protein
MASTTAVGLIRNSHSINILGNFLFEFYIQKYFRWSAGRAAEISFLLLFHEDGAQDSSIDDQAGILFYQPWRISRIPPCTARRLKPF